VLVAAFEGWNDAGDAASEAIEYLEELWQAQPFAAIDPEDYYDFQVNRPVVTLAPDDAHEGEFRREIDFPTTRFSVARPPGLDHDVVLVHGVEPNMRWRTFCDEVLAIATELGVELFVTLGALLADTPHTRPLPVNGTASDPDVAKRLGVPTSRYEGPTGIVGVLQEACHAASLPALSLWVQVPHYVAQPPCPKATIGLLRRVEDLLDVEIPLGDLPEEARDWERAVDELTEEDSEVREYVQQLESREPAEQLTEATGDAIAREFEKYLRRRGRRS
jgi:proteasome assembly chaperone (PAC2) family protein